MNFHVPRSIVDWQVPSFAVRECVRVSRRKPGGWEGGKTTMYRRGSRNMRHVDDHAGLPGFPVNENGHVFVYVLAWGVWEPRKLEKERVLQSAKAYDKALLDTQRSIAGRIHSPFREDNMTTQWSSLLIWLIIFQHKNFTFHPFTFLHELSPCQWVVSGPFKPKKKMYLLRKTT